MDHPQTTNCRFMSRMYNVHLIWALPDSRLMRITKLFNMTDFDFTMVELTPEKDNLHSRIRYVLLVTYWYILTDYNFQTLESSPVNEVTSAYRQIGTSVIFVKKSQQVWEEEIEGILGWTFVWINESCLLKLWGILKLSASVGFFSQK